MQASLHRHQVVLLVVEDGPGPHDAHGLARREAVALHEVDSGERAGAPELRRAVDRDGASSRNTHFFIFSSIRTFSFLLHLIHSQIHHIQIGNLKIEPKHYISHIIDSF